MHQMHLNLLLHNAKDETTICLGYYVFTFRMHELMYSCMCFRMHTSVQFKLVCSLHVSNNDNKKRNNPFSAPYFTSFLLPIWGLCLRLGLSSVSRMPTICRLTSTAPRARPYVR